LLSNVVYTGSVSHKGTVYPGEHEGIIDPRMWERVNERLNFNSRHQRGTPHDKAQALLRGLLYCGQCGEAMVPMHTTRHGHRYGYYVCQAAGRRRGHACAQRPIAAVDLDGFLKRELAQVLGRISVHR
jgi:site-specific DNA recombinase